MVNDRIYNSEDGESISFDFSGNSRLTPNQRRAASRVARSSKVIESNEKFSEVQSNRAASNIKGVAEELQQVLDVPGMSDTAYGRYVLNYAARGGGDITVEKKNELFKEISSDVREEYGPEFDILLGEDSTRAERNEALQKLRNSDDSSVQKSLVDIQEHMDPSMRAHIFNRPEDFTTNAILNKIGGTISPHGDSIRTESITRR